MPQWGGICATMAPGQGSERMSMTKNSRAWAVAAALLGSSMAFAQAPAPGAEPSKGEIKAMREFKMLDFNGDGKLSRSEVKLFPRLANAFDEADTDHDGFVSYEEVRAFAAKYRAERDRARQTPDAPAPAASSTP
jgi:hypothetical protein